MNYLTSITSYISFLCLVARIVLLWVVFAAPASAGHSTDVADLSDLSLEELMSISVSIGTLFDENELDIANTVDLITHEQWEARGAKNYLDAIGYLPSILPLQNIWGSAVAIRGFATNLSVRGVGHLVDGVAVNSLTDMSSSYDEPMQMLGLLDRIEVLRGPGSAIYGSDAFHGVFSLKTFRSDEDVIVSRVELGDLGVQDSSIKISQAINKQWRINAAVAVQGQGDQSLQYQFTNPATLQQEISERENKLYQQGGMISFVGNITSRLNTHINYYATERSVDGYIGGARGLPNSEGKSIFKDKDHTTGDSRFNMLKAEVGYQLEHDTKLVVTGHHWKREINRINDVHYLMPNWLLENRNKESATGADVTLKHDAQSEGVQWLVQLQHKTGDVEKFRYYNINQLTGMEMLANNEPEPAEGFHRRLNSVIFQSKVPFLKSRIHVIYGGRIDYYSDFGEQRTPKLGLIYRPQNNQSFKFNYGQAFRAPSPTEILSTQLISSSPDIGPEIIDSYEVSFLQISQKQRYSVTLFNSQWKDSIVADGAYVNNDKQESFGVEFGVKGVNDSLKYELNGAYVRSRNVDTGTDMVAFPETALNAIGTYYWHKYDTEFTLSNRLKMQMKEGPVFSGDASPKSLPLYFRMDLNITHHLADYASIWLSIRNLANRENYLPSLWNVENGYRDEKFSVALGGKLQF